MTLIVVGSINVDLVASGERMPGRGETVLMRKYAEYFGGKGANQAAAAATLGAEVMMIGAVGGDPRGAATLAELIASGVDVSRVIRTDRPTGVAMILVTDDGENSIAVVPGANAELTRDLVRTALAGTPGDDHVVLASLEIPLDAVEAAADLATERGWRFVVNPAPARALPARVLSATSVITPNAAEVRLLGGAEHLLAAGVGAVVVTRGGDGVDVHLPDQPPQHLPAARAEVVDTTGAGDAFTAALGVACLRGHSLLEAALWANAVGALATEGPGARGSLPTTEQASRRMRGD
jgi:ribokinase